MINTLLTLLSSCNISSASLTFFDFAPPPISKHPNADEVENGNGFYIINDGFDIYVEVKDENMNIIYTSEKYFYKEGMESTLINHAKTKI